MRSSRRSIRSPTGTGRVGRALIHTVLARRGLTERAVLPISLVLATLRGRYVEGLNVYRHDAPAVSARGEYGDQPVARHFHSASAIAVGAVRDADGPDRRPSVRLERAALAAIGSPPAYARRRARTRPWRDCCPGFLRHRWSLRRPWRRSSVSPFRPRVLRWTSCARPGSSGPSRSSGARRPTSPGEVLDLITLTERALASTRFDTRALCSESSGTRTATGVRHRAGRGVAPHPLEWVLRSGESTLSVSPAGQADPGHGIDIVVWGDETSARNR